MEVNLPPISELTASIVQGPSPLTVDFNGSASSDDSGVVSYSWDFGDGSTGTGIQLSHIYTTAGTFNALLTVTDADGLMNTDTVEIIVEPSADSPISLSSGTPLSGDIPLSVNFTGSDSTDDVGIVSYTWDFGDGVGSNLSDPQHDYVYAGIYTASLTVTDEDGNSSVSTLEIDAVDGSAPLVCADYLTNDTAGITLSSGSMVGGPD
ncbi:PKD domain-containing protein, partial [Maribacter aquivivus]|uniref:PKD domain-containing protein n=1 Tax=Maribacter aquivivus TaxID=228958 RepID=UPI0024928A94